MYFSSLPGEDMEKCVRDALMLWATVDPIGTMALFVAVTARSSPAESRRIAFRSTIYGGMILIACIIVGQYVLDAMGISLPSLMVAGGIILFLFGLQMVFGSGHEEASPERDTNHDLAIFPMAIPSIAGPGAIMSAILLTDNDRFTIGQQVLTGAVLVAVLIATYVMMRLAGVFTRFFGKNGAAILVRVMGMLLAALSVEMVLEGLTKYFHHFATQTPGTGGP